MDRTGRVQFITGNGCRRDGCQRQTTGHSTVFFENSSSSLRKDPPIFGDDLVALKPLLIEGPSLARTLPQLPSQKTPPQTGPTLPGESLLSQALRFRNAKHSTLKNDFPLRGEFHVARLPTGKAAWCRHCLKRSKAWSFLGPNQFGAPFLEPREGQDSPLWPCSAPAWELVHPVPCPFFATVPHSKPSSNSSRIRRRRPRAFRAFGLR